jgi:hypothetical protein
MDSLETEREEIYFAVHPGRSSIPRRHRPARLDEPTQSRARAPCGVLMEVLNPTNSATPRFPKLRPLYHLKNYYNPKRHPEWSWGPELPNAFTMQNGPENARCQRRNMQV